VELPDDDGDLEDRSCACRRQHGGAQTERHDAGDHTAPGGGRLRVPPGGTFNVITGDRDTGRALVAALAQYARSSAKVGLPDDEDATFGPVNNVNQLAQVEGFLSRLPDHASIVWTKDFGRAMRMSRQLDFGVVWINTHIPFVAEMPHGGFKHSGYGKDLSMYGFEDYTRIKHVMANIDS